MQLPEPQSKPFSSLLAGIEDGRIRIPQFQRGFVWTMEKVARLIDSILKSYPIGTFVLWRTSEHLRSLRKIGGQDFPQPTQGEPVDFVLDGQQRLTSLYACFKGLQVPRGNGEDDFGKIFVNLSASKSDQIVSVEKQPF